MNAYSRGKYTVPTRKIAYAWKSFSLKLAPPFWLEIFNKRLPRMVAPFSLKRGAHLKNST